jgi:hypothetical protein
MFVLSDSFTFSELTLPQKTQEINYFWLEIPFLENDCKNIVHAMNDIFC